MSSIGAEPKNRWLVLYCGVQGIDNVTPPFCPLYRGFYGSAICGGHAASYNFTEINLSGIWARVDQTRKP
jgi:hypothetical protein